VRIAAVARDLDLCARQRGWDDVRTVLLHRRDRAYDPAVVDVVAAEGGAWLDAFATLDPWDAVLDAEPVPTVEVAPNRLEEALVAVADFADLKSPWFLGHSRGVADLAASAAAVAGLDAADISRARTAGLVHDLGVVAIPSGVWDRPGPISAEGWERVRLHAHTTERILARCPSLAELAVDAGAHHERIDGTGYHRGARNVSLAAQLVAAADIYRAMCEDRPHRPAHSTDAAAGALAAEADARRLARAATDAVLAAAGHRQPMPNVTRPAGLTEREIDVLRLIARGRSNKEVARQLGISSKTVGTHVEHIYAKTQVTTRAGATLFAMERDLLRA
jgi:HD-GYP domain-containing protein (c-di-GMP phosphodiesterase class II)